MVVNPSFAAKTVPEFIANAKANPGKINMATVGFNPSLFAHWQLCHGKFTPW
jgi:tripartite-type tricarboxylate transporter receptor subunit TctC